MMKIKKMNFRDSIEFVGGGGAIAVIGLIMLGVAVTIFTLFFKKTITKEFSTLVYVFGSLMFLIGFIFTFCRHGVKVNRSGNELEKWIGLLFIPLSSKRMRLSNFSEIRISKQIHRSKNSVRYSYPVDIISEKEKKICLINLSDQISSRSFAEKAAVGLQLPLNDSSGETATLRNYDELDMSIRELAEKNGKISTIEDAGEIPNNFADNCKIENNSLSLKLAPAENNILKFIFILPIMSFPMVLFIFIMVGRISKKAIPTPILIAIVAFILLVDIIMFFVLKKKTKRLGGVTQIIANPEKLTIYYGTQKLEWDSDEIEEFILLPKKGLPANNPFANSSSPISTNGGITVRSDKLYATFGYRFTEKEQEWLYKILYAILTASKNSF